MRKDKFSYRIYTLFKRIPPAFFFNFLAVLALISALLYLLSDQSSQSNSINSGINYFLELLVGVLVAVLSINVATLFRRSRSDEFDVPIRDKNIIKLEKIIEYDKKRKDIEEEIGRLTCELTKSDISQYIDVNRLAFSGQNASLSLGSVGKYDAFLKQFGLSAETAKTEKNTAVFLTPFSLEGRELFAQCQAILGKTNIFLRQTDNLVDKDDILMNIVSLIVRSELVLVNLDGRNPNVYYELGISHALGKPTILLSNADYALNDIGFDLRQKRIIIYRDKKELETELLYQISRIKKF